MFGFHIKWIVLAVQDRAAFANFEPSNCQGRLSRIGYHRFLGKADVFACVWWECVPRVKVGGGEHVLVFTFFAALKPQISRFHHFVIFDVL